MRSIGASSTSSQDGIRIAIIMWWFEKSQILKKVEEYADKIGEEELLNLDIHQTGLAIVRAGNIWNKFVKDVQDSPEISIIANYTDTLTHWGSFEYEVSTEFGKALGGSSWLASRKAKVAKIKRDMRIVRKVMES